MCPMTLKQLAQWKDSKKFPVQSMTDWTALNPYQLRERGLHEKLSLEEFGRIFYQISCHRGYRFGERNLKLMDSVLSRGNPAENKIGYLQTQKEIGQGTLGGYLNRIYPAPFSSYRSPTQRIRNRICTLEMYFNEIHQLWKMQAQFYHTLTDDLRDQLIGDPLDVDPQGALFFQRPLSSLRVVSKIDKIVDPVIRELVAKSVGEVNNNKHLPAGLFIKEGSNGFPISTIHLKNDRGGDPVPVFKVRMREGFSNAIQLKANENRYAIPRNNHHIMISVDDEGNFSEEVVIFWEAIQRYRKKKPIYRKLEAGEGEVITHLHINDMFLLGIDDVWENIHLTPQHILRKHLYRVQKLSSKYYEFRLANKYITSNNDFPDYIRINNFGNKKTGWLTHKPAKVKISLTGEISLTKV